MGLFEQKRYKQKRVVQCNRLKSSTITKMVNNRYVSVETIDKICTFLEVQPSQIMEWQNKK